MSMLSYQHFPIYAIMSLFLGAFLVVMLGKNRAVRNALAFISVSASLGFLLALVKRVMIDGEVIAYWMGGRVPAGATPLVLPLRWTR